MGFLGENNKVSKGLSLFEEFKVSMFGFVQVNLVYGSKCARCRSSISHKRSIIVRSCRV